MTDVPSVSDVLTIIFLLLPGFVAIHIARRLGRYEFTLTDFETTTWSLFGSLPIDAAFVGVLAIFGVRLTSFSDLSNELLVPGAAALFVALALIGGGATGLVLRYTIHKGVRQGAVWDVIFGQFMKRRKGIWITVYTSDGKEYQGALAWMSQGPNIPKEILLRSPIEVFRSRDGEVQNTLEGADSIYFRDSNIDRVAFETPLGL